MVALLGKRYGIRPAGCGEAAGLFGEEGYHSVADITDGDALAKVRSYKQQLKAAAQGRVLSGCSEPPGACAAPRPAASSAVAQARQPCGAVVRSSTERTCSACAFDSTVNPHSPAARRTWNGCTRVVSEVIGTTVTTPRLLRSAVRWRGCR